MAQNLNYHTDSSWCHDNTEAYCNHYGRLYNWEAAIKACPAGWHLPGHKEWIALARAVGGKREISNVGVYTNRYADTSWRIAGNKLKTASGWKTGFGSRDGASGTDDYVFSALPGGRRDRYGDFAGHTFNERNYDLLGFIGSWWTPAVNGGRDAYSWRISGNSDDIGGSVEPMSYGLSVRCVIGGAVEKVIRPVTYTLTLIAQTGGTVSRKPDEKAYNVGEKVTISASPDRGYTFTEWTGGKTANAAYANTAVTMNSNMIITANFRATSPAVYDTLIDARDGKAYKTVKMPDGKVWMAENLNYLPQTGASWCYGNSADSCDKYGRLYDIKTARKVCPAGWHLSKRSEWDDISQAVGGKKQREDHDIIIWKTAGKRLKARSGWLSYSDTGKSGDDNYGFLALPGGIYGNYDDSYYGRRYKTDGNDQCYTCLRFFDAGCRGNWWVDDEYNYSRMMIHDNTDVLERGGYADYAGGGRSVRCVKNAR